MEAEQRRLVGKHSHFIMGQHQQCENDTVTFNSAGRVSYYRRRSEYGNESDSASQWLKL